MALCLRRHHGLERQPLRLEESDCQTAEKGCEKMSTHDVPGSNPANNDELGMGCWAEHDDGSLVFVESTEGDRVIYSMFDMARTPPVEYRDAMAQPVFEKTFGRESDAGPWTWHDKTLFPWDRVIKAGFPDGARSPSAEHTMTAAQRVADSLQLR